AETLTPPADGEVYVHELEGFAVRHENGTPLGLVSSVYEMPAGLMIEVQGPRREFLLPYRKEFVLAVDREARRLVVAPPAGLIDDGSRRRPGKGAAAPDRHRDALPRGICRLDR